MAIRAYRRPLPSIFPQMGVAPPSILPQMEYEDVYVILEAPLLEYNQKDLLFLRSLKIDPFML
jgi:hypothetical protein